MSSTPSIPNLRPPATPLIAHDPYFSVWSFSDRLTDGWTKHWTGAGNNMCGILRIDGRNFRFAGAPSEAPDTMDQRSVEVLPTRTIYTFEAAGIALTLTFLTPALPHDLDVLSRSLTYLNFELRAIDGATHQVSIYFDVTGDWTVDDAAQTVAWGRHKVSGLRVLRMGSHQQRVLERAGDNLRIEWGYLYAAAPDEPGVMETAAWAAATRTQFCSEGTIPDSDDLQMPRAAHDQWPALAFVFDGGEIGGEAVERRLMLAYDDIFSLEYFQRRVRPFWRRAGMGPGELLRAANSEYEALRDRCVAFDEEIMRDLRAAGGEPYARLCALAFRQCLSAHKLAADFDGTPLYMSKENFSNGCIDTVDVTYPSAPFFLLFNPELLRAQITPILEYARSPQWKFPFAPHDLGTYPLANGQVYGGGEVSERDQMPVEECGNMLILVAALAHADGSAEYARRFWPILRQWAGYLKDKGLDPENQLCTDDFAGHMAHNTNLSLKAIIGLGGYARLCEMIGEKEEAAEYRTLAEKMAHRWAEMADDGDHYRLSFDKSGTWSQKYNLVWDKLLGLGLFPAEIARKEIAYYKTKQEKFGLPLDSRSTYTKLDWIVWSATLADSGDDFRALVDPLYDWAHETPTRVPMTDWYWTQDGKQVHFQARSVVGGLFIKLLADGAVWKKWRSRAS